MYFRAGRVTPCGPSFETIARRFSAGVLAHGHHKAPCGTKELSYRPSRNFYNHLHNQSWHLAGENRQDNQRHQQQFFAHNGSVFRGAKSACEIDDQADEQNQAQSAAADDGSTEIKPATTEQEKQNHYEQ